MYDPAEPLAEPLRKLRRVHVRPRRSLHSRPEGMPPEAWPALGPIYIIAETLIEQGFIELRRDCPVGARLNPTWWITKMRDHPPRVAGVIRDVYRWAMREWQAGGAMWLVEGARWLSNNGPTLQAIIQQRNVLAELAAGTKGESVNGTTAWPRLADFVFALDQGLDRIADLSRRIMIRCYLEGRLSEEEKRTFAEVLDAHDKAGMWPNPERDINEVTLSLGLDLHNVVPLRADQRQ